MQSRNVKQLIWGTDDFDVMNWHDCPIYALAFPSNTYELWLDIDYIFEWIKPSGDRKNFQFVIAPATLIFDNVHNIDIDFDVYNGMEIDHVIRETPAAPPNAEAIGVQLEWTWIISCHRGDIRLNSIGFRQYTRAVPRLSDKFKLGRDEAIPYSFSTTYEG